jgi:hypothetical protein
LEKNNLTLLHLIKFPKYLFRCSGVDDFWLMWDQTVYISLLRNIYHFTRKEEFAKWPAFKGSVGNACLAFCKDSETDSGTWHRAVVSQINGDVGTVTYVDYGESGPVKMSELKHLPTRFAVLPPLAFRCTLDGINSTENDVHVDAFAELFWNSYPVTAQFKKMKAGKLSVRLFTSDNVDLTTRLFNEPSGHFGGKVEIDSKLIVYDIK